MGELLGQIGVLPTSAGGVLVLIFVLMATGRIPTLRELRDSQERERRAMDLADKWQKVAAEQGMSIVQILDGLEVANHALTEIQSVLERTSNRRAP